MRTTTLISILSLLMLFSCVSMKEKKSAKYYIENETKISEIIKGYDELYQQQPFNLGFSERDYSKLGLDIITDTIRYAITNQQRTDVIQKTVKAFGYDTVKLRKLYTDLYEIRAIWLGRDDVYFHDVKSSVTYLSFRSVAVGNPFLDRKYYTLVFFDPSQTDDNFKNMLDKQGFRHVKNNIYFSILGRFR
jgi:hypothetical protein